MEEIFVPLKIKDFEDCKISNMGRFMTSKGKIKKPEMRNGTLRIDISKKKNGVRVARLPYCSLSRLVYIHFADCIPTNDFEIQYKDGNRLNCRFDNLKLAFGVPTAEQIQIYNDNVFSCVQSICSKSSWWGYRKNGFDMENCIAESYCLIWKYLSQYNPEYSFYGFCKRYVRVAFLNEYKNSRIFRRSVEFKNV